MRIGHHPTALMGASLLLSLSLVAPTSAATMSLWPFGSSLSPAQTGGCPEECSGRGACNAGKCFCFAGWTGASCNERACGPCAHGQCAHGECTCNKGWTGSRCDQPACPNACSSHGSCVNGTCHCADGFGGVDCAHGVCPRGCSGHGTCTKDGCICEHGYAGEGCDRRACPNEPEGGQGIPCSGRGTCYGGRCLCRQPFGGEDCSLKLGAAPALVPPAAEPASSDDAPTSLAAQAAQRILRGPCAGAHLGTADLRSQPCGPNGRCERGSETCHCFVGWSGALCDEPTCLHNCSGRGECGAGGVCACRDGYRGPDCSVAPACPRGRRGRSLATAHAHADSAAAIGRSPVAASHVLLAEATDDDPVGLDCSGRGACVEGECRCYRGWAGLACENRECPSNCHGRGTCQADGTCLCGPGWTGLGCAIRTCEHLAGCHGRGFCADGECVCSRGWTGATCESKECPQGCSEAHGVCDTSGGTCVCKDGWSGALCDVPPPCPNGCSGRGACVLGLCVCEADAGGADCSQLTCPGGCSGHGSCNSHTGKCECDAGYEGTPNCAHKACEADCHHSGVCAGGKCICFGGFTGRLCERRSCGLGNCSHPHGRCDTSTGACVCAKGFSGKDCSLKECNGGKGCSGNGVCQRGKCFCRAGWRGDACDEQETCVGGCGGKTRGQCISIVGADGRSTERRCQCLPGFSGPDCSLVTCSPTPHPEPHAEQLRPTDKSGAFFLVSTGARAASAMAPAANGTAGHDSGCGPHGACDGVSGNCVCAPGWSGPRCDVRRCPKDCAHAGICFNGGCICETGRTGPACGARARVLSTPQVERLPHRPPPPKPILLPVCQVMPSVPLPSRAILTASLGVAIPPRRLWRR